MSLDFIEIPRSRKQSLECIPQLYLYGGRCEAICPPKTYPGINAKKKAACLPCHYTCLTCVGESDGHCTSCHGESTPVPSGLTDTGSSNFNNSDVDSQDDVKMEDLSLVDPEVHLSWGKRSESSRQRQVHEEYGNKSMLTKKAVTKKILEPYNSPRPLFYCYPTRVFDQIKASDSWYRRMTVIFAVNLVFLIAILIFLLWRGYCSRRRGKYHGDAVIWRYLKNDKSAAHRPNDGNIIYLPSSSDEDDLGINK
ncbi:hypothetical protein RUM44_005807 [Polyplax serrata]|uniref:Uncharacterized protein n=1 Tax=Polyplax serrata TaxID=468196 RepID=A0ABR1AY52_POLSC